MTQTQASPFAAPISSIEGITEYKLTNGLTVIFLPDQTSQNVTVCMTYLVGSRHEGRGEAGMAHLLEHMLFKGTPEHPNIKDALQDRGAFFNASTWYDRTNYYETLSASGDNLEFALKLEADRMINSWIRQEDFDTEMTVVRNEFEMGENDPVEVLHDQMLSIAYQWHNYGKTTIGNRSDIERVAIKNLKQFYQHYYQPDNAVLIVAGHFDIKKTQNLILNYFGQILKPSRNLDETYTVEPAQDGARNVKLLRAGEVAQAALAYHIPAASHPDFAALLVLSEVLSNEPSGLLFQAFVQTGMAARINTSAFPLKEPGIFIVSLRPAHINQAADLLEKMIDQLENLTENQINAEIVERAKLRILKHYKMAMMNSNRFAFELSESIAQGDYRLFFYMRDQVKTTTVDDVIRVASNYLIESNRTSGLFIPTTESKRAIIGSTPNVENLLNGYCGSEDIHLGEAFEASTENIDAHTLRSVLNGTIKTSLLLKPTRGQVNRARLVFRFGSKKTLHGKEVILQLIPSILRRGTKTMSLQQVQDKLDKLQSTLKIYPAQPGVVVVEVTSDKPHLEEVILIASDLLQAPRFLPEEFAIVQQRELTDLINVRSDPMHLGMREMDRLQNPFPHDSIFYFPTYDEIIAELNAVTLEKIQEAYHELYGANHLEVAIVGDVNLSINATIEKCFANWNSRVAFERLIKPHVPALQEVRTIVTPDKQMAIVIMGVNFTMRDDDQYYPAMRMANYIFGESMKSRLMQRLREKEGLSYDTGSSLHINRHDFSAGLTIHALCPTDKADFVLKLMQEEYHLWIDKGVTEQELQDCKQSFQLYFHNVLANDEFVLQTLSSMIDVNRTFGYYTELLDKMQQLQTDDIHKVLDIFLSNQSIAVVKAGDFPA